MEKCAKRRKIGTNHCQKIITVPKSHKNVSRFSALINPLDRNNYTVGINMARKRPAPGALPLMVCVCVFHYFWLTRTCTWCKITFTARLCRRNHNDGTRSAPLWAENDNLWHDRLECVVVFITFGNRLLSQLHFLYLCNTYFLFLAIIWKVRLFLMFVFDHGAVFVFADGSLAIGRA